MIERKLVWIGCLLVACSDVAQEGHAMYATEMLGKCKFSEAIDAANEAQSVGDSTGRYYFGSLLVEAQAYAFIGDSSKQNEVLLEAVRISPNLNSIDEVKSLIEQTIGELVVDCDAER